ncbi:polysaccharide deacetylase family protein [Alicyclobacillus sp.]|uniref:polysaccharide deacetylase family protein n=1 Tax=Alicyclobacillus sp. TaxID=61169 RepID=UPI0025C2C211|nr:polysaccharide deacetylase family protein [Alicyclobacillus sp.]MCL6516920.1 polysaccharide deacetylase family protein [Alicyclobacillus sp.]
MRRARRQRVWWCVVAAIFWLACWAGAPRPARAAEAQPLLGPGSHGEAVTILQQELAQMGDDPGPADGWFGPATLRAVLRFQASHGLVADGWVGPRTWAALAQAAGGGIPDDGTSGFAGEDTGDPNQDPPAKRVILTFDDGPSPWTARLVDTLREANVPAVFFWNTYHIQFANDAVMQRLRGHDDILIGDHTVDHADLIHLSRDAQSHEILDAKRTLERVTGQPVLYFRPPYGDFNATTRKIAQDAGMQMVMWDVDTLDWKYGRDEAPILRIIQREVRPGAIILMHDHLSTIDELPDIIRTLRNLGYGFTNLPQSPSDGGAASPRRAEPRVR